MATKGTRRPKAFVDSSVLANWILLDGAISELRAKGDEEVANLRKLAERRFPSYDLLEKIRSSARLLPVRFGTSLFAIGEITKVVLDEYILKKLYESRLPFRYWDTFRNRQQLTDDEIDQLWGQISRFLFSFLPLPSRRNQPLSWFDGYHAASVMSLIGAVRVSTTDAFLVGNALANHCKYFVTEDEPLRKLLKAELSEEIKGVASQTVLTQLLGERN